MFDEEENNDFSAETIMGAILRKQRELPWIFGKKRAKEGTADDGTKESQFRPQTEPKLLKRIKMLLKLLKKIQSKLIIKTLRKMQKPQFRPQAK